MRSSSLMLIAAFAACLGVMGCRRQADAAPPLVTPTVTLDRMEAGAGSPVEVSYRFIVSPNAVLSEDYRVFAHFLDADRELMWTDDHQPPIPTRQWKAGSPIEYARTMFVPKFPYVGEATLEVGLYSPQSGARVPMEGDNQGQRSYRVANFSLRIPSDDLFVVFKEGWHDAEISGEGVGTEWQWSRKQGILAFRNPMKDALMYLQLDQPVPLIGAERVDVRLGSTIIDSFALQPNVRELRKIAIKGEQFGTGQTVELVVEPERSFVPAQIPALKSNDQRELGVRVFRAFLQPR